MAAKIHAKSPTRWGDRHQRRLDILEAARIGITTSGYGSLNMRDLAARAGVSPATLYSYFATKEVLFATLYVEAIEAHTAALVPIVDAGHDLATFLALVFERYTELYRNFGQHFTVWSTARADGAANDQRFPRELAVELRAATHESTRVLMRGVRSAAEHDGRQIIDATLVPPFIWSTMNGLADHFTSERQSLDFFPADQFIEFSMRRLAAAITEPAA